MKTFQVGKELNNIDMIINLNIYGIKNVFYVFTKYDKLSFFSA